MATEVGTYEAKTRLPQLIRQDQQGQSFTITNRGEPAAQLAPVEAADFSNAAAAIDAFLTFKARNPRKRRVNIKALVEDGPA